MELLKDENVKVRISTLLALGELGDYHAVESLIPLLNDKNDDISKSALKALEMITGEDYRYDTEKWNEWWVDKREIYITDDSENPGYQ
jgi:HEAT repeat protein